MAKGLSLHIGVNQVDPGHYAGWSGPLVACEADAEDMTALARARGFAPTTLLTANATRAKAIGAIEHAAHTLVAGDILFVSYSGHGGQVPDLNDDEPDHNDETWCLYDGELLDDELYALWSRFKAGVRVLVLSDSCHSGSVTRDLEILAAPAAGRAVMAPELPAGDAPRYRVMPSDVALRTYRTNREFYGRLQGTASKERTAEEIAASVRLISGCQDNQLSLDGSFNGLFTGTLLRVWKEGAFTGPYAELHREIVRRMPPTQTPNHFLVGAADGAFDTQSAFTI